MFGRKSLGQKLKSQAESLGACERGLNGLEKLNEHELINRYVHFIDFGIENNFPSNEFIKDNFDKSLLEHNNIYVDAEFERRNARQVVVVQGKSVGRLLFDGFTTSDVYVRHNSEVDIDCSRMSKIFISVYDNAIVNVSQRDGASVYVYLHGDNCSVISEGEVMIRKSRD
jgi:uncharacterized Rossmann fold enzyme